MKLSDKAVRFTLTKKISLLLLIPVFVSLVSIAFFVGFLDETKTDSHFMNVAGRQRMLSAELREWAHMVAIGQEEDRVGLRTRIAEFEKSLSAMNRGGEVLDGLLDPAPPEVRGELAAVDNFWRALKPALSDVAVGPRGDPKFQKAHRRVESGTVELRYLSSRLVTRFEERTQRLRQRMFYTLVSAACLTGIAFLAGVFLTRRYIVQPILRVEKAARRIAGGDLSQRLDIATRDELSVLAYTFNQMVAQTEQLLRELNLRRRHAETIIASVPAGLLVLRGDLAVLSANRSFRKTFGVDEQAITRHPMVTELLPVSGLKEAALEVLSTGEAKRNLPMEMPAQDGSRRLLRITLAGTRLAEEEEEEEELLMVVEDVSEEHRLREQAHAQEARYQNLVQGLDAIVWEVNAATFAFTFVSRRAEVLLGYPVERWVTERDFWASLIHPEDREQAVAFFRRATAQGSDHAFDYRVVAADGRVVWLHDTVRVVRDEAGRAELLCGVMLDITERKRIEMDLATINESLTALIEAIPDAVFLKDGGGRWLITNEPAKQMFQLHSLPWQGKTDMELADMHPAFRTAHEGCLASDEKAWQAGQLLVDEEGVVGEDGRCAIIEARKMPLFSKEGQRKGLVAIGRDITERKRAVQELRLAATAFETQEGILITDRDKRILRVNHAFTRLTGYSAEEAIGQTPAMLHSGRQDAKFYIGMWETINRDHYWQGEIWNRRKDGVVYPEWLTVTVVTDVDDQVTHYVAMFSDITLRKEADEKIYLLAFYDSLTGLPNRRLLYDRLQQALSVSTRDHLYGAVLMLDLDNFKRINDTRGHDVGDRLLAEVALRIQSCVRQTDTVARLGGDEFIAMLVDLSPDEAQAALQAEGVGKKILAAINQPCMIASQLHHSSASMGLCLFLGQNATLNELLKRADSAMYQAKNSGRNTLRFYDPQIQDSLEARVAFESELRDALPNNQLRLYYQIQVDNTHGVLGAEALLRWEHPQHGLVPPDQFITMAEELGLIVPIGEWVLQTACEQLRVWADNPVTENFQLAVNVSPRQFRQPDFVAVVGRILAQTGIKPQLLKLELTESLVLHNIADTVDKMEALNRQGIHFSMDDFGTGYSSLAHLTKLPIQQLKIDRSFMRNIASNHRDAVVVQTIIGMANNLGVTVIAEGVETEEQRACLERFGCMAYQGYLFGKPMPLHEFEELAD